MSAHTSSAIHSHFDAPSNRRAPLGLLALLFAFVAVLSLAGCVGVAGSGALTPTPASLSFGDVATGSSSPQTLTLMNTSATPVTISGMAVAGTGFTIVGGVSSFTIAPGLTHQFQVKFAPTAAGNVSGSIAIVSDGPGSPLSIPLTGTGTTGLAIVTQPRSLSVITGQTAPFSVTAKGLGTLSYQWEQNGAAISGATEASYLAPGATLSESGTRFTVVVSDGTTSVTSSPAILTVMASAVAPAIATPPVSQTVAVGQSATFSVVATGTATLTYQWTKNGSAISGATSESYATPATTTADNAARFAVTVTNNKGSITSSAATLTVDTPPTITSQPTGVTVATGKSVTFRVSASGTGPLTYQWKANGAAINGATASSYAIASAVAADNGKLFSVTVSGAAGSVTSNSAALIVSGTSSTPAASNTTTAPSFIVQPVSKSVVAGQTATFSATATGSGTLTYQWNKNGIPISGAASSSYTTPATTTADSGAQFTVTVSNSVGQITSAAATLTVSAATAILNASRTSLNFSSVDIGSNSTLSVGFTNGGNSNVTISNVSISGAGYAASGVQSGQILTPGQTATLNVTFAPAATGAIPGSVTVTSNASNSTSAITLAGTGVQAASHSVTLTWTASTSTTVTGYNVYRSTVSGGPYTKLTSSPVAATTYADGTVQSGQTYYYVVTSVDSTAAESAYSTEVSATIP